ncbi:class I SAM-dependent methyltransferase [Hansschlegelia plantiphila]|uniref:Methyltransferase domain-containing protein n=1 Tax=Hansschlegelia plantiphila TaxID=374655 RepID=A0A9W6J2B2_9HYPH|nr:class I SAM-dependent methyltransferase [Hansschlegelia plantiphila]GLK68089.1 hypothetical protein GCM10008179_17270 [Hansschlegelia plantiphila]
MTDVAVMDDEAARTKAYWDKFYAQTWYSDSSTFCRYVAESAFFRDVVVDLGCGNGRDSFGFAKRASKVVAVDQSAVAVENGNRKAAEASLPGLSFAQCELQDGEKLSAIFEGLKGLSPQGVLFYCRFVLHAIDEPTQDILLSTVAAAMGPGDVFAAEFRTSKDANKNHVHGDHYRRYQDAPALAKQLSSRWGLTVRVYQEGNGFSPYNEEDPELCRLIALRS